MSNRSRTAVLKNRDHDLTLSEHTTDSPILPAAQLERLHSFRPDLVDWVANQTEIESNWRRGEVHRINTFVFIERLIGQICGLVVGLSAIAGGVYAATHGAQEVGVAISTLGLGTLAVVFITGRKPKNKQPEG